MGPPPPTAPVSKLLAPALGCIPPLTCGPGGIRAHAVGSRSYNRLSAQLARKTGKVNTFAVAFRTPFFSPAAPRLHQTSKPPYLTDNLSQKFLAPRLSSTHALRRKSPAHQHVGLGFWYDGPQVSLRIGMVRWRCISVCGAGPAHCLSLSVGSLFALCFSPAFLRLSSRPTASTAAEQIQ